MKRHKRNFRRDFGVYPREVYRETIVVGILIAALLLLIIPCIVGC